jgi:HEAT repeat protein
MNLLIEALETDCVATKVWAVKAIARMGSAARNAVPAINKLRKHSNESLRDAVALALEQIGVPAAMQARQLSPQASMQVLTN